MHFTTLAAAVLAFATSALAQTPDFDPIFLPKSGEQVQAGSTFKITWDSPEKYDQYLVTIALIGGPAQNSQDFIQNITSGIPNSADKYEWTVDSALGHANVYGLKISLDRDPNIFQYSNPFQIVPVASGASTTTTSATVTTGSNTVTLASSAPTTSTVAIITSSIANSTTAAVSTAHANSTMPTISTGGVIASSTAGTGPAVVTSAGPAVVTNAGSRVATAGVLGLAGAIAMFALAL